MKNTALSSIRREYGTRDLLENTIASNPITQFNQWFDEIVQEELEPTAMTLATVDSSGMPDIRVVLLKDIVDEQFIFYTHYDSAKGKELIQNPKAAINFFWLKSSRQVRVRGIVEKIAPAISDIYFSSRPRLSQLSAIASQQSQVLKNRSLLEDKILTLSEEYGQEKPIPRPAGWGGYKILPLEIEFWQGRDNRLHDRIRYKKEKDLWTIERLFP